ncbi:inhibitor of Bruton tyrosine kinase isoform X1 [Spodoptera litura]|uniref:Inhibitor of Bruton tyrosine kinase isoform X1 n=2 Tax=Spodoptera litura TaxID=69820 RepID=A0A9J7EF31_SPOLT|nr:inhibitor of Bruton tyrosine kinase isoform X1 [Spodoptera litura]XP_022826912.1 inhibitor of Bruton tyrosine kinase isoform X1 [Spodoptera litura]XP_022826989.1 inhibitor of Bruton tyrosine kinase isoform X1 [Spodoptera litura]
MSKHKAEVDCTVRCRSRSHGQALTSAITKRSISDQALASFIKATCANFNKAFDFEGRTALHTAASRGRLALMDWLIRHSSVAFINARDRESGYTPLHRSVFYGQIHAAVALMKIGVNMDIVDKDDYKALEHLMLDRQYMYKHEGSQPSEVYVWGSNCNYTLGTGTQQQRNSPELLTSFNRANTCVKQVCLGKFHSVWLSGSGEAWCCGQQARAGGPHATSLRPTPLKLAEPCVAIAITLNSTIFLMESGTILQYALNSTDNVSQSTTKAPASIKLSSVKPLLKLSEPRGVRGARAHAVVWNARALYSWGHNYGQLGHSNEDKFVPAPKRVAISLNNKEEAGIQLVDASDAATVITTSRGDVYLLHKYICKKIAIKQINLRQVCVEAKVNDQGSYSRVTVLLLTNVGQLFIWQDTTNKLTRCVFGLVHQTIITHVALTHDAVYFTTKYGEAFIGTISRKTTPTPAPQPIKKERERDNKSPLVKFLEKDDCTSVRISKIPNIYRAVSIAVDSEGLNFACLQIKPTCGLRSLPQLSPTSMSKHMESLRECASEDDLLHDVIFKVGQKSYPAHIYIIASSSDHLYKLYQEKLTQTNEGDKPEVTLENVHPEAFERVMKYIYTGSCDVAELGPCGLKITKEELVKKDKEADEELEVIENPSEMSAFEVYNKQSDKAKRARARRSADTPPRARLYCDPVKLVQATAKRLQVMALHKLLDKFYYKNGSICLKESASSNYSRNPGPCWDREAHPELVDTHVVCKDGAAIPAHKCVLAARLDYFQGMFMHSWTESKMLSKVTLPINYGILLPVINFLYTDSCQEIENSDSIDFICNLLIVADQLFITRLREMCEIALANLINLKNCAELCQFGHTYNATQLKQCCMEFISLNLNSVLENRTLDLLEDTLLDDITQYYCKFNPIMSSRVITPFFNAPSDEVIKEFAKNYPVNLELTDEEYKKDDSVIEIVSNKKKKGKKIEYTESEKERMRYESVSSVTSLDLSNDTSKDITLSLSKISKDTEKGSKNKQEKWTEVPSSQQKQLKVVQARLKAINIAKDIMNEAPSESFTKLTMSTSSSALTIEKLPTSSRMSVSPKESPTSEPAWGTQGNLVISHVGPKLSQKQRKKLVMQGNETASQTIDFFNKVTVGSPPDKPKNPWKICEPPVASSSPKTKTIEFNKILTDQKKQKEDHSRIMTKPLLMTQLEDKAIEQLERFYNVHEIDDELITVRRIELQVSSPQWLHTAPKC